MKYQITLKKDIGKNGPGIYVLDQGKKDIHGKPIRKVITITDKEKIVEQSQKRLTEIDALLEPAKKAGLLRHTTKYEGEYDDIPATTYEEALKVTSRANQMFETLPASFRNEMGNNPKNFLDFIANPENAPRMKKLGMLKGNDGLTSTGAPSGAPTPTDMDGDGVTDPVPPTQVITP